MKSLTPFDRQVLLTIGRNCRQNSPIKARHWTEPPRNIPGVEDAIRHLGMHKMIQRKGGLWYKVQPTEKGWRQIKSEKESREFLASIA